MTIPTIDAQKPITTPESLRKHLHQAAQVELSTIPLYLYALYSIQTQGYSQWSSGMSAVWAIRSVVIEEMLHLCLARNLLIAVGGWEGLRFYDEEFVPRYPAKMLHHTPDLILHLEPCTTDLMKCVFMPLELPEKVDAPPEPHRYHTLGQFYDAIRLGFDHCDEPELWAANRPDLQYGSSYSYWNQDGGGKPIVVANLTTAQEALNTIVEQGEGASPGHLRTPKGFTEPPVPGMRNTELSHYAKFKRISDGIDLIGTVWPVPTDPSIRDIDAITGDADSPVSKLARFFNASYCYVLAMIDAMYMTTSTTIAPGALSARYGIERRFLAAMGGLLYPIAALLVAQPLSDGSHAAPTFEWHDFADHPSKKKQLAAMCDGLLGAFPSLGGDNGVRSLIAELPKL